MLKTSYILNSAKPHQYLEEALNRLQLMKRGDEEFIVVYAGTDDCTDLKSENPWVDQWIIEKDQGEAHGLNKGILATHGTVIRLLTDEDEFIIPVFHEAINLCLQDDVDAVFVAGKSQDEYGHEWVHPGSIEDVLNFKNTCGLSLCFRRSIIPLVGLLDSRYIFNDVDFISRLIRSGVKIRTIDKIGFIRWYNQNSNAMKYKNRIVSERKLSVLSNSDLSIGNNPISSSMINDILNNQDYAKWLGAYIDKGIMHFSSFELSQSLLSEKIMEIERYAAIADKALHKQDLEAAETALHFSLENAPKLFEGFMSLANDLSAIKCRLDQMKLKDDLAKGKMDFISDLAQDIKSPEELLGLADICLDANKFEDAADYFKLVILKKPDDITAYMGLVIAAKNLNDEETLKMANEKIHEMDPSKVLIT